MRLPYHETSTGTRLDPEEQQDPLLAVDRLYDASDLEYLRCYLWQLFKAVISDEHYAFKGQPIIAWETVDQLETMIDIVYELQPDQHNSNEEESVPDDPVGRDWKLMRNLYKIHHDHKGSIRRLTIEEINNLHLFAKAFFNFKSLEEWKSTLRHWLYFAISAESIYDASPQSDLVEVYEQLEKLIETTFLLHKRRSMTAETERQPVTKSDAQDFRSLKKEGVADPLAFICRYFCDTTLSEHLTEMKDWIQAVFSTYIWHERAPSELVWFHDETVKLIEAAYWLYSEKKDGAVSENRHYEKPLMEPFGYRIFPHYLNEKEEEDPWLVLEQLSATDFDNLMERLRDWLTYGLHPRAIEDHENDISMYHLLQKLAEALYIIAVRASKADDSNNNDNKPLSE